MRIRSAGEGFTLIEIVVVVAVVGVLGVFGTAKMLDLRNDARRANEEGVVGAIRGGLTGYGAESDILQRTPRFPPELDSAQTGSSSPSNVFFGTVLESAVSAGWTKNASDRYTGLAGGVYRYGSANGTFTRIGTDLTYSDFSSLSGWSTSGSNVSLQDGKLIMGTGENRAFTGDASWTDYTVNVNAKLNQGQGYGIFFRTSGTQPLNGYSFQYDPGYGTGSFIMRRWVNGSEQNPFAVAAPPAGFQWTGTDRSVSLDVQGNTFRAYVDGELVLTGTNSTYSSGSVGLRTWGTSTTQFDNFQVTRP